MWLSNTKKDELTRVAKLLLTIRNEVSEQVHPNFENYIGVSRFQFESEFVSKYKHIVSSHYLSKALQDVYKMYKIRSDAFLRQIRFEQIYKYEIISYQVTTKYHNKGDFKCISKKTKHTDLSRVLTYLAQYGRPHLDEYIQANVHTNNFYPIMVSKFHKFGYERLLSLAIQRRTRILNDYKKRGPIKFESLTFNGRSRLTTDIVRPNKNKNSRITHFLSISWVHKNGSIKPLHIPIKYNKKYHKNLKRYITKTETYYTVVFKKNKIYFVLYRSGKRVTPQYDVTDENTIGIDVNSKHNLLSLSDGSFIPHDEHLVAELTKHLLTIDKKQRDFDIIHNKAIGYKHTKRDTLKSKALILRIREYVKISIARLCKEFKSKGIHHVSLENLTGFKHIRFKSTNKFGMDTGRVCRRLNLSSIKDEFTHIAPHYEIAVSLVQPQYTSQACECGCVDSANRPTQEQFKCSKCGYSENADIHSAKNIKNRLTSTVLRGKLLNATNSGYNAYLPKSLYQWQIKGALEKYHRATCTS